MSESGWQVWTGKRQLFDKRGPIVTIQAKGNFGLSRQAFEALGEPSHVAFMYNPERRAIALRKAHPDDLQSYSVKKQNHADSYVVSGRAFLLFVDFPLGKVRSYRPAVEGNGDMLVIELDKELPDDGTGEE